MRFLTPVVAVLTLWILVLPAPVHADASVARGTIRGVAHEFHVPTGWTTRASEAGIEFQPPAGQVKKLRVAVVGVETSAGTDGRTVLGRLVDDEKARKQHLRSATSPEPIDFAGAHGQLIILSGTGAGGDLEGEMLVVSVVATTAYQFSCEGLMADMNAHVDDIVAIIAGVRVAGGTDAAPAPAADPGASGISGALRAPAPEAASDPSAAAAPRRDSGEFILVDGAFGLKLKPLRFWKLAIADDEYQLERTNEAPAAVLAIRRVPYSSEKKYLRDAQGGGRARQTHFAGAAALLVEGKRGETIERTYHLVRGTYALVFEFRVVGRTGESGADARVFEIEQALVLEDQGAAGALTTYGGVSLATSPGWKLAGVGPGRANFRSERGVEVEVRVRPWPASKDPFAQVEDAMKSRCGKDPYTRNDAAVLGAASAVRFRCASRTSAQVVLVASGVGADGGKVYVQVTAENRKKKGAPADAEIAEFGAYVALPR